MLHLLCLLLFSGKYVVAASQLLENIQSLIDLENIETAVYNASISLPCSYSIYQFARSVSTEVWAMQMLDACTKAPPSGILKGNFIDLGDYDSCMDVNNDDGIIGKYCIGQLTTSIPINRSFNEMLGAIQLPESLRIFDLSTNTSMMFAACMPSSCSASDLEVLYSIIGLNSTFAERLCRTIESQPSFTTGDIFAIMFFMIVLVVALLSTVYDVLTDNSKERSHALLRSFSLYSNTKKLLEINASNSTSCLHGVRVLSLIWMMLGHRLSIQIVSAMRNFSSRYEWFMDLKSMIFLSSHLSVDSFFLLSGLLVCYVFMSTLSKGIRINLGIFYLHRFLRIAPILYVSILVYLTLLKHGADGPLVNVFIQTMTKPCTDHWWLTGLFIQNYLDVNDVCIAHSWYLAVDMQLYVISPAILFLLYKHPRWGISVIVCLIILVTIGSFLTGWFHNLYGLYMANFFKEFDAYNRYYYFGTHTRAAPWLIGLLLGYAIYRTKEKQNTIFTKSLSTLIWIFSLATLAACIFVGQNTFSTTYEYDKLANAFFLALPRSAWALGISMIIYSCVDGHGGVVNWFLSLPVFRFLSKLSFSMYLIHFPLMMVRNGNLSYLEKFAVYDLLYIYCGDFVFTLGIAFVFTLLFEAPIIAIERCCFNQKVEAANKNSNQGI